MANGVHARVYSGPKQVRTQRCTFRHTYIREAGWPQQPQHLMVGTKNTHKCTCVCSRFPPRYAPFCGPEARVKRSQWVVSCDTSDLFCVFRALLLVFPLEVPLFVADSSILIVPLTTRPLCLSFIFPSNDQRCAWDLIFYPGL